MKRNKAFTLMELMIVIAIIMILSGAIVARIGTGSDKAKIAKATAEMNEIAAACRAMYLDTGVWPQGKSCIVGYYINKGWDDNGDLAFYTPGGSWKGPYLETADPENLPLDPWQKEYRYYTNTTKGGSIYINCDGSSFANNSVLVHRFNL